ncbi:HAD family hydrolase [Serratia proteamaculans]|uniref:HAD family hydrolase n=1 Tax=Serratia proteamaculans TaxID=28151 RepID=UPI0010763FAA|nr:HAD family hydrolase [Serratia proteamaculans]TFZ52218.1 HAD family hydrolase [Serratia proteamaculans]
MKPELRVIMFDLDGTLFDTAKAIVSAFRATFQQLQLPQPADDELIRETIGLPLERAFAQLLAQEADGRAVTDCVAEYQRQFQTLILPMAASLLFPGVAAGLQQLKGAGFHLAVTTNKFARSANSLLAAAGIAPLFDVVVCADQVTEKKPAPESGNKILEHYQVRAQEAVMVGDTTHDILMAHQVGCPVIAVDYGIQNRQVLAAAEPSIIVSSFAAVVDWCRHRDVSRAAAG